MIIMKRMWKKPIGNSGNDEQKQKKKNNQPQASKSKSLRLLNIVMSHDYCLK